MTYLQNVSGQKLPFEILNLDRDGPALGLVADGVDIEVVLSKDGGPFEAATGTVVESGGGWYYLETSAADMAAEGTLIYGGNTPLGYLSIQSVMVVEETVAQKADRLETLIGNLLERLTAERADKIDFLDASILSRSSHPAPDIAAVLAAIAPKSSHSALDAALALLAQETPSGTVREALERLNLQPADRPVALAPDLPEDGDLALLYVDTTDIVGVPLEDLDIAVLLVSPPPAFSPSGRVVSYERKMMVPLPDPGRYTLELEKGLRYRVSCRELGIKDFEFTTDADLINLKERLATQ